MFPLKEISSGLMFKMNNLIFMHIFDSRKQMYEQSLSFLFS